MNKFVLYRNGHNVCMAKVVDGKLEGFECRDIFEAHRFCRLVLEQLDT